MAVQDQSLRAVVWAVAGNAVVTLAKFLGWIFSGSPSMLAEAAHSLADTINQALLYVGIRSSIQAPTRDYPSGRGAARYIWNLISAMGIFFLGFGISTFHGIENLTQEATVPKLEFLPLSLGILLFSFLVESFPLALAWKVVQRRKGELSLFQYIKQGDDPTPVAVLLEDAIAIVGVLVAIVGIGASHYFKTTAPDAAGSIVIGILIGVLALTMAYANGRLLLGAAITHEQEEEIRDFINSQPTVEKVTSLKTEVLGPGRVRLAVELEFHGGVLIDRRLIERDAERIREGEEPTPILVETAERTVRLVGREINLLESVIQARFPYVVIIDLEVN